MISDTKYKKIVYTCEHLIHRENNQKVLNRHTFHKRSESIDIYNTCALQSNVQNLATVIRFDVLGAPNVDLVLLFTTQNGRTIKKH